MTLVNGFRSRMQGILLCADREEDDGFGKTEVDKIYEITTDLKTCEVFISGAGPSEIIGKAKENIYKSLIVAEKGGVNVLAEHQVLIEGSLRHVYREYRSVLNRQTMGLIVVVAPRAVNVPPLMYTTVEDRLYTQYLYCAHGTGKPISDYFADRLYKEGMDRNALSLLGAFILREAERKASGVGMGFDMVFINDGERRRQYLGRDTIRELQGSIPPLPEAIFPAWEHCAAIQGWLARKW